MRTLACLFLAVLVANPRAHTEEWTEFRGPSGAGHAEATPPIEFSAEKNVRWKTPIDGVGWSSPVVENGRIWFTTAVTIGEPPSAVDLFVYCVAAKDGEILIKRLLRHVESPETINTLNSYASPTPVISSGKVICHFGTYGTWCLRCESGETVWEKQIKVEHGVGPGSSPVLVGEKLILTCDGMNEQAVIALDVDNGSMLWRTPRPALRTTNPESKKSFCTPAVVDVDGETQIVVPSAQWICGYSPTDGREIWRIDHGDGFSLCCRPVVAGDLLIFTTGYMRPELVAVRCDGRGDVTQSHLAWRVSRGAPSKPSPIVVGDSIYMVSDSGIMTKVDALTGDVEWKDRLSGNYSASPLLAGGKLYFASHEGSVFVIEPGSTLSVLAENSLPPRILSSPTPIENDLIIRTEHALWRIGE